MLRNNLSNHCSVSGFEGPCELEEYTGEKLKGKSFWNNILEFRSESPYKNNQLCKLTFQCPDQKIVVLDIIDFDVFSCADNLTFAWKDDETTPCPKKIDYKLRGMYNWMEITFHSNSADTAMGFRLLLGCADSHRLSGPAGILILLSFYNQVL